MHRTCDGTRFHLLIIFLVCDKDGDGHGDGDGDSHVTGASGILTQVSQKVNIPVGAQTNGTDDRLS